MLCAAYTQEKKKGIQVIRKYIYIFRTINDLKYVDIF